MHDIKYIRLYPKKFTQAMQKRNCNVTAEMLLKLDETIRNHKTKAESLRHELKEISKKIGDLYQLKDENKNVIEELSEKSKNIKQQIILVEEEEQNSADMLEGYLISIPNILDESVPEGQDGDDNVCVKMFGQPKVFDFNVKQHFELGEDLGMMDFTQTAKISGSRFVTLKSQLAKLERALATFMLDVNINESGYTEFSTPLLVKEETMYNIGQLPKFADDSFVVDQKYRLIPTSEVTLTSMVSDKILQESELPIRMTAHTQCFRSEAGSAGRDTRGMIRLHQFSKVELVSITTPEESKHEHERMLSSAEKILQKLGLPYRVMLLCSGDTGFCATKTYDIEVWLPGQNTYREISSCSNCNDFQGRRMKARYKKVSTDKNEFVHTLNGSSLPIGRTIVAIMENYQNLDGSITIPDVLIPYMGGVKVIEKKFVVVR